MSNEIVRLVQNKDLHRVNETLGPIAPFFWVVYANFAIQGISVPQAVDRSFKLLQSYLGTEAVTTLQTQTRAAA